MCVKNIIMVFLTNPDWLHLRYEILRKNSINDICHISVNANCGYVD